jgi:hypothetical protein
LHGAHHGVGGGDQALAVDDRGGALLQATAGCSAWGR